MTFFAGQTGQMAWINAVDAEAEANTAKGLAHDAALAALPTTYATAATVTAAVATASSSLIPKGSLVLNVRDFGATGNGSTDDTVAIQAALNAVALPGAIVFFPPGDYKVTSLTVSSRPTRLVGAGWASSLVTPSPSANLLTIPSATSQITVEHLYFRSSVTRTGGWYVNNLSNNFRMSNFHMLGASGGIRSTGTVVTIERGSMRDGVGGTGIGIQIDDGYDVSIRDVVMANAVNLFAGIKVTQCGDLTIEDCNLMVCGDTLVLNPGAGQVIASVYANNTFFDTAVRGLNIYTAGGSVVRSIFSQCWFSSHTQGGIVIDGSGATNGVDFIGCHVFLCGTDGIKLLGSNILNIRFNGCAVGGNSGAGFTVVAGVSRFAIQNCRIGNAHGTGANLYPIYIAGGASTGYIITGNDMSGNTNAMADGGTGTKVVANNLVA